MACIVEPDRLCGAATRRRAVRSQETTRSASNSGSRVDTYSSYAKRVHRGRERSHHVRQLAQEDRTRFAHGRDQEPPGEQAFASDGAQVPIAAEAASKCSCQSGLLRRRHPAVIRRRGHVPGGRDRRQHGHRERLRRCAIRGRLREVARQSAQEQHITSSVL